VQNLRSQRRRPVGRRFSRLGWQNRLTGRPIFRGFAGAKQAAGWEAAKGISLFRCFFGACHVADASSDCNEPIAPTVVTNICNGVVAQIAEQISRYLISAFD
jgi:hypothetical protein